MHARQQGLTMIETLISVAIVAVLFGFAVMTASRIQQSLSIATADSSVAHVLSTAARQARDGVGQSAWGVYFAYDENTRKPETFTVFKGASYAARDVSEDINYAMPNSFDLSSVQLGGSVPSAGDDHEIVFSALSGATADYGTITLEAFGQTRFVHISPEGIIATAFE